MADAPSGRGRGGGRGKPKGKGRGGGGRGGGGRGAAADGGDGNPSAAGGGGTNKNNSKESREAKRLRKLQLEADKKAALSAEEAASAAKAEEEERARAKEEAERAERERLEARRKEQEERAAREQEDKDRREADRKLREEQLKIRKANLDFMSSKLTEYQLKSLNSTVKSNTTFQKKLSKVSAATAASLISELKTLNLTRYITECVQAVVDAPLKLADVPGAVQVCSALHQAYPTFANHLVPAYIRVFQCPPKGEGGALAGDRSARISQRRIALRMLSELVLCGVWTEGKDVFDSLKATLAQDGKLDSKDGKYTLLTVLVGYARYASEDIFGILPKHFQLPTRTKKGERAAAEADQADAETPDEAKGENDNAKSEATLGEGDGDGGDENVAGDADAVEDADEGDDEGDGEDDSGDEEEEEEDEIVEYDPEDYVYTKLDAFSPELQQQMRALMNQYFDAAATKLVAEHEAVQAMEEENRRLRSVKGELSEERTQDYENARKILDKLRTNVASLAEHLERDMPNLPVDKSTTRIAATDDEPLKPSADAATGEDSVFEDDESRLFYESLMDLRGVVPDSFFESSAKNKTADAAGAGAGAGAGAAASSPAEADGSASESATKSKEDGAVPDAASPAVAADTPASADAGTTGKDGSKDDADDQGDEDKGPSSAALDTLLHSLNSCVNIDAVNKIAVDFCTLNSKGNRKRLARALFNVTRTKLDLLPYYARLAATLNKEMSDIATNLAQLLEDELYLLMVKKDVTSMETRVKDIRFLCEMCKFRLVSPTVIFKAFQLCLDDFGPNIEVVCNLLETAGRFLYRCPETNVRTRNMLDIMMRLKNSKNLDNRLATMVDNAFFMCRPPERSARAIKKQRPPMHEYIRHLMFVVLNKKTVDKVLRQMRCLPWVEMEPYVVKCLLKVEKGKFNHLAFVASLVSGLNRHHDSLGVKVVDSLLSEIRSGLEDVSFRRQQRMVSCFRFLGELYNYSVVDSPVIFHTLYTTISNELPDPKGDCFKITLVCTMLDTCAQFFNRATTKKRLDLFLCYFQRYLFMKGAIPLEIEFMLQDTFEGIRGKRFSSLEDCETQIAWFLEKERDPVTQYGLQSCMVVRDETGVAAADEDDKDSDASDAESGDDDDVGDGDGDDDGDDDDDDVDGDDDDDEFGSDEDENIHDESDDDDMDRDVGVVMATREVQRTEEDDEFERAFGAMMQDSVESRKYEQRVKGTLEMGMGVHGSLLNDSDSEEDDEEGSSNAVVFKMLVKKGNKAQVKKLPMPSDCSLAVSSIAASSTVKKEHDELKRLVLQYEARDRREAETEDFETTYTGHVAGMRDGPVVGGGVGVAVRGGSGAKRGQKIQLTGLAPRHRGAGAPQGDWRGGEAEGGNQQPARPAVAKPTERYNIDRRANERKPIGNNYGDFGNSRSSDSSRS